MDCPKDVLANTTVLSKFQPKCKPMANKRRLFMQMQKPTKDLQMPP